MQTLTLTLKPKPKPKPTLTRKESRTPKETIKEAIQGMVKVSVKRLCHVSSDCADPEVRQA